MAEFMDFDFRLDHVQHIIPRVKNPQEWHTSLLEVLPQYDITDIARTAAFMAQCAHESGGFTMLSENLNYSAQGLMGVFKKYFPTLELANAYARQPEKIANRVYGGRMGNGPESSGEGYKFRGRGLIQLTGKDNYRRCSEYLFEDWTLLEVPDCLTQPYYALHSACWFWSANKLNTLADQQDIRMMTKRINGGFIGLEDRVKHYNHALEVLQT
jgi:putative chitinase